MKVVRRARHLGLIYGSNKSPLFALWPLNQPGSFLKSEWLPCRSGRARTVAVLFCCKTQRRPCNHLTASARRPAARQSLFHCRERRAELRSRFSCSSLRPGGLFCFRPQQNGFLLFTKKTLDLSSTVSSQRIQLYFRNNHHWMDSVPILVLGLRTFTQSIVIIHILIKTHLNIKTF